MKIMLFIKEDEEKRTPFVGFSDFEELKGEEFQENFFVVLTELFPEASPLDIIRAYAETIKFFTETTNGDDVVLYLEELDLAISTSKIYFYHRVLPPELSAIFAGNEHLLSMNKKEYQ